MPGSLDLKFNLRVKLSIDEWLRFEAEPLKVGVVRAGDFKMFDLYILISESENGFNTKYMKNDKLEVYLTRAGYQALLTERNYSFENGICSGSKVFLEVN